jgi:hypothetical protein
MSLSRTTLRLITVLFLLAGILLLRKPVFGQANGTSPQIRVAPSLAVLPRQGGVAAPADASLTIHNKNRPTQSIRGSL